MGILQRNFSPKKTLISSFNPNFLPLGKFWTFLTGKRLAFSSINLNLDFIYKSKKIRNQIFQSPSQFLRERSKFKIKLVFSKKGNSQVTRQFLSDGNQFTSISRLWGLNNAHQQISIDFTIKSTGFTNRIRDAPPYPIT